MSTELELGSGTHFSLSVSELEVELNRMPAALPSSTISVCRRFGFTTLVNRPTKTDFDANCAFCIYTTNTQHVCSLTLNLVLLLAEHKIEDGWLERKRMWSAPSSEGPSTARP